MVQRLLLSALIGLIIGFFIDHDIVFYLVPAIVIFLFLLFTFLNRRWEKNRKRYMTGRKK